MKPKIYKSHAHCKRVNHRDGWILWINQALQFWYLEGFTSFMKTNIMWMRHFRIFMTFSVKPRKSHAFLIEGILYLRQRLPYTEKKWKLKIIINKISKQRGDAVEILLSLDAIYYIPFNGGREIFVIFQFPVLFKTFKR